MFKASTSASASALTETNSIVTATSSATATSLSSYQDALNIATNLAENLANETAKYDVNLINQTVNIVNDQFIKPLEQFQNSVVSPNNIRLGQVLRSLNAFKKAIYNVDYLANLVNTFSTEINNVGQYPSILQPIVEKGYYDNTDDFWIYTVNLENAIDYFAYFNWQKYSFWTGLSYEEIVAYNNENGLQQYNEYLYLQATGDTNSLNSLISKYNNETIFNVLDIYSWNNGLKIYFSQFQKDVLNPNQWIKISSGVDLQPFIPNTDNVSNFSQEYLNFINDLSNQIAVLNGDDWQVDAIWPYINPAEIDTSTCLYSNVYPSWTGLLINECFIPGSDIDIPSIITNIINDLYYNYPNLVSGSVAISTYNIRDIYYVSLLKIDTYNGIPCFKEKRININSYFTNELNIINDTIIYGSLSVRTYDDTDIIRTDNVYKITTFNNKIGVNQDFDQVKGLIDVDGLSNNSVINIMNDFIVPSLYSYDVTIDIKDEIHYGDTSVTVPSSYQNDVFIFKTPLLNAIQITDIQFLYTPSNTNTGVFTSKKMDSSSFIKIQTIVNEINKMLPQYTTNKVINLDNTTEDYTFSFVELLNDTNYYYLCSLRAVIETNPVNSLENEVYFICSFLDVNSFMINPSYVTYMNNVTDSLSSCSRLLNLSNLIVLNPDVQDNLFKGQSISSSTSPNSPYFSDQINNSVYVDFRNRFGGKSLYIWNWEYLTNEQIKNGDISTCLFHELFNYYNMKKSNEIFQPNTDISITNVTNNMMLNYSNNFGENKQIMSFFINYDWVKGRKVTIVNVIPIQGKYYITGSGFNLPDVLDQTIIAKGDNFITGNFTILDDTTDVPVFSVNREQKMTYSVYHTGIGTNNPTTMMDINDCGITDIINMVNYMSSQYNLINYNLNNFIKALQKSEADAVDFIETSFIDPKTGNELLQNINNYLYFNKIPNNLISEEEIVLYNNLYLDWNNYSIDDLLQNDINDQEPLKFLNSLTNVIYNTSNFFNKTQLISVFEWVAGIKVANINFIQTRNNFYMIGMGVNLQQYLTYQSNDNIQKFFDCIESYSYQLQDIVIRYNNIPSSSILNQQKATIVRNQARQVYPIQTLVQYTIDFNNLDIMTISNLNYNTLQTSDTRVYINIKDTNLRTKLLFIFNNLKLMYTSINLNDYGVLNFQDKYNDFVSLFWCSSVSNNLITLFSLELQINTIVIPSLNLKGDMKVCGDAYFTSSPNGDNSNTYIYIDSDKKFFGVNSLEIYGNYSNTYTTTTNSDFAKQNVCMSSETYPNVVAERSNDPLFPSQKDYFYFKNFSTFTARRTSKLYSYNELYNYSKKYTSTNTPGLYDAYGGNTNFYGYGPDISYEIKDKTGIIKEMGNLHMVIESMDNNPITGFDNLRTGFGVSVVDTLANLETQEREILHVDNQSCLYVNTIKLGGNNILSVDKSGNLLFNGKKVKLEE